MKNINKIKIDINVSDINEEKLYITSIIKIFFNNLGSMFKNSNKAGYNYT